MSGLITRVVRVNDNEEQRSTVLLDLAVLERICIPVGTIMHQKIEVELIFDPPLQAAEAT